MYDVETQSANHKYTQMILNCAIFHFTQLFKQQNNRTVTNQSENENNKYTDKNVIDFLLVFVSKVILLRFRETSIISSYITSLIIEYLYKFRFFGLWAKHDSFTF